MVFTRATFTILLILKVVTAFHSHINTRPRTKLSVAVDPTVITKKEYEDICGVSFDSSTLDERLKSTNFLYPKHVDVVEDIAPIAGAMVDDVVRKSFVCQ